MFLETIKETQLFAAAVYWMFTLASSHILLELEKRLGVGGR